MMIYPHLRVEFSYSSVLLSFWVLLLAVLSWVSGPWMQGIAVLVLTMSAVTSPHGESRLLFPIIFLSERLLDDALSLHSSQPEFYASLLLSYLTLVVCRRERTGHEVLTIILKVIVDSVVGLLVVYIISKDCVFSVGTGGFVLSGFIFFIALRHVLGENEAVLIGSFVGFYICDTVINNNVSGGSALVSIRGLTTTKIHITGRAAILVALYQSVVLYVGSRYCMVAQVDNSKSSERTISIHRSTSLFWASLSGIVVVMHRVLTQQFNEDPVMWLWSYITSSTYRLSVVAAWFFFIPISVICLNLFTKSMRKTARRKLFHLIAVCAFTPVAVQEPEFLSLALSVATSLAILIELARFYRVYGSSSLNRFVRGHIDNRDSISGVVRTHIYLIYGIGLSMVLHYRYQNSATVKSPRILELSISIIPGILGLGIVDACAGIVGSTFLFSYRRALGRYLNNELFTDRANFSVTHKTTTGTIGGMVCGFVFWLLVLIVTNTTSHTISGYTFFLVFICSLTECFIDGIDNLQLPLVVYGIVLSFFAFLCRSPHMWE